MLTQSIRISIYILINITLKYNFYKDLENLYKQPFYCFTLNFIIFIFFVF